jgi:predicted MFS family arabinose efflux permease
LVALALQWKMPALQGAPRMPLAQQLRVLRTRQFLAQIALSVLVFTAMFTAYTYLAEILERAAGIAPARVGWWLMGFGAIGLAGNWLGGRWAERHALGVTAVLCLALALGMAATVQWAQALPWLVAALAVWGVANTALYPVCQIRVMQAAPQAQALAGTANVSAANAGIALGALGGGWALQAAGPLFTGRVAAGLAVLAAVVALYMARPGRARHTPRA